MAITNWFVKRRSSFTLMETLVAVAIIALMTPAMFGMIYGVIRAQVRIYQLKVAKREGDYFLTIMENRLRNDVMVVNGDTPDGEVCTSLVPSYSSPSIIYFTDRDGDSLSFALDSASKRIKMTTTAGDSYLTSDAVSVSPIDNVFFSCEKKGDYLGSLVRVQFTIQYNRTNNLSKPVLMNYQTWVLIRRY